MSISGLFGSRLVVPAPYSAATKAAAAAAPQTLTVGGRDGGYRLVIECSSRPQKKGTAHHLKTRPRKSSPSDIRRGPTVYPPLPPLPPEWSFISEDLSTAAGAGVVGTPQLVQSESF